MAQFIGFLAHSAPHPPHTLERMTSTDCELSIHIPSGSNGPVYHPVTPTALTPTAVTPTDFTLTFNPGVITLNITLMITLIPRIRGVNFGIFL